MNREWMYLRFSNDDYISLEFQQGIYSFIEFACSQPTFMDRDKTRCPCRKCKNKAFWDVDTIRIKQCIESVPWNGIWCCWPNIHHGPSYRWWHGGHWGCPGFIMLRAVDNELWSGCRNHSRLSLVARMTNLKSKNNISEKCFDCPR